MGTLTTVVLQVACSGLLFSGIPGALPCVAAQPPFSIQPPLPAVANQSLEDSSGETELPDSPGASLSKPRQATAQVTSPGRQSTHTASQVVSMRVQEPAAQDTQSHSSQPGLQSSQKPVGTAAAGAIPASGIA